MTLSEKELREGWASEDFKRNNELGDTRVLIDSWFSVNDNPTIAKELVTLLEGMIKQSAMTEWSDKADVNFVDTESVAVSLFPKSMIFKKGKEPRIIITE